MSNSSLVEYVKLSPHTNPRGNNKIKKITIHHMAGNLSIEACGDIFAAPSRQASSNYGVGSDGRVGMYAEEDRRAWTSSSPDNDYQAITIEVANDGGAPDWHISDTALEKTIELCADICKRNGIEKLIYTGDANGNLTRHNMFAATTCPGPYLQSKYAFIEEEVNKLLTGETALQQEKSDAINAEGLFYFAHVENLGDCEKVHDGQIAGTTGFGVRLEALQIDVTKLQYDNIVLSAKIHIEGVGWVEYEDVIPELILGSKGESRRIEAVEFDLQGLPSNKVLRYQVHLEDNGWTGWVNNGFTAGTVGISKRIEAIKMLITDK